MSSAKLSSAVRAIRKQTTQHVVTLLHAGTDQDGDDAVESRVQSGSGRAKSAARRGPVIITDRGQPSHVLLTFDDYQQLIGRQENIIDLLGAPPGVEDADLQITPLRDPARAADLG